MKKIFLAAAIIVTVVAVTSCGSSRKYGCPSTAATSTNHNLKA